MVRMLGYHSTKVENLPAIREQGLEARKTTEHNYASFGSDLEDQPVGVYVLREDACDGWGDWGLGGLERGKACVIIDMLGLSAIQDPEVDSAWCIPVSVPADRLTIVEPQHPIGPLLPWDFRNDMWVRGIDLVPGAQGDYWNMRYTD